MLHQLASKVIKQKILWNATQKGKLLQVVARPFYFIIKPSLQLPQVVPYIIQGPTH